MESTVSEMGLHVSLLSAGVLLIWIARLLTPERKRIRIRSQHSEHGRRRRRR